MELFKLLDKFNTCPDPDHDDVNIPASVYVICNSCNKMEKFPPHSNFCKKCKSDLRQH